MVECHPTVCQFLGNEAFSDRLREADRARLATLAASRQKSYWAMIARIAARVRQTAAAAHRAVVHPFVSALR